MESSSGNPIWYTSSLARSTWTIEGVYTKPFATEYKNAVAPTFPTVVGISNGASYYWEQEKGTDEVFTDGTTNAIAGYVESGDYDIGSAEGEQGEGEFIMRISRIMPDYGSQTGDSRITLSTKTFPNSTAVSTNYTSTTSTTQLFARARARQIAIKVGNTSTGQSWRMGTFRLDIHPGGRR
jgi:predicted secreted protein